MTQRGSVRKRGTTWTAYFHVGEGKARRQRSKGGFKTKKEAIAYLTTALSDLQKDELVEPRRLTLGEYLLETWLPIKEHTLRPSTFHNYRRLLERHVIPALGNVQLQRLTAEQLDHLYRDLLRSGSSRGGGLSPKTVRHVHTTLQKALGDAERKRLVQRNVALGADAPKLERSREMSTWTPLELQAFLRGIRSHRLYAAFLLAATTGMRRGEILGLRWRDVDFPGRRLSVRQTLVSVNYQLRFGSPKTNRSRRSLALDPATLAQLQQQRRAQDVERELIGAAYADHDLVFARPDGNPIHPDYFSQTFDRAVARLKLRRIRLHDLRHTYATLALAAGVPAKVISDRLGHATVAFTQDVYMHAIPELEAAAADHVAALVLGTPASALAEPTPPDADASAAPTAATSQSSRDEGADDVELLIQRQDKST